MCVLVSDHGDLPAVLMMNHAYQRVADAVWDLVSVCFHCMLAIYLQNQRRYTTYTHPHMLAVMLIRK
jgi:RNAse (barnase) inhibitor barstar